MRIQIPEFETKKQLFTYLKENKKKLIDQKKSLPITSDPVSFGTSLVHNKTVAFKDNSPVSGDMDTLRVKVVANTANWVDTHMDLLLPDAPLKSIQERKGIIPHLHDHVHKLEAELGDVVDIYLTTVSLRELGLEQEGSTQVLVFVTDIKKDYNEKIFNRYKSGKINQHSIGLQYIKLELAINDSEFEKEMDFWNKYYPQVINKDVVDEKGYFWVVPEYRLIENSAVLFGSNMLTPTLDNNMKNIEPVATTQKSEPSNDTRVLDALNQLLTKIS